MFSFLARKKRSRRKVPEKQAGGGNFKRREKFVTKKTTAAFPNQLSFLFFFSFFRKFANGGGRGARVKIARGAVLLHRLAGRPRQKAKRYPFAFLLYFLSSPVARTEQRLPRYNKLEEEEERILCSQRKEGEEASIFLTMFMA